MATFRDVLGDAEDWFWKLELNAEYMRYELFLAIPSDWITTQKSNNILVESVHEVGDHQIIKIYSEDETMGIDDLIKASKLLVAKNKELERRKQEHQEEMERLKNMLIEKEASFMTYVDEKKENLFEEENEVYEDIRKAADQPSAEEFHRDLNG